MVIGRKTISCKYVNWPVINKFVAILVKTLKGIVLFVCFCGTWQVNSKIYLEKQRAKNSQGISEDFKLM